ncbi:MAG TPA: hypothetical protein PLL10_07625, partial [Elusimicrobiales bacterium]|nr:hypothetical protein [Elusimicrobiales bacterium]
FDAVLWGKIPLGYHITSLSLHATNAVLCYFFFRKLFSITLNKETDDTAVKTSALCGALFFALHPLRAESVAWITARRDLVSGFFAFAASIAYLSSVTKGARPWFSAICFACAVLSRESIAALAPVLLALDAYPLRRLPVAFGEWLQPQFRPVLREKILFFLIAFFGGAMAVIATRNATFFQSFQELGLNHRAGAFFYGLAFYPLKTLWPSGLAPLYEIPPGFGLFSKWGWPAVLVSAILFGVAFKSRRKWPAITAVLVCYSLLIFPSLGIAQTISLAYDRFSYISCVPFAALFGGAVWLVSEKSRVWQVAAMSAAVLWLAALGISATAQTGIWHNSTALWTRVIKAAADRPNETAYLNRCQARLEDDYAAAAHADCSAALQANPRLAEGYLNRGLASLDLGDPRAAYDDFEAALGIEPGLEKARFGRASALLLMGRYEQAVLAFTALSSGSLREQALLNRSSAYHALKKDDLAMADLETILAYNREHWLALANRARLREEKKLYELALEDYESAIKINPLYARAVAGKARVLEIL